MTFNYINAEPKEFVEYLMEHRFKNNAAETATFLLQAMDHLPNMEEISSMLLEDSNEADGDSKQEAAEKLGEVRNLPLPAEDGTSTELLVSASTPRTKLNMSIFEQGVVFTSSKDEQILLHPNTVKHVIFFPKREDCLKKPKTTKDGKYIIIPGSHVLLILEEDKVEFRNKTLSQICINLPQHHSLPIDVSEESRLSEEQLVSACIDDFEQKLIDLFACSLHLKNGVYRVYNPKHHNVKNLTSYAFQSDDGGQNKSILHGQMPYLKCYHGVNDGVIYPMEEGLLFFKPPIFVHRSQLHSIAAGRGGGSRYVDLHAKLDDGNTDIEFTNIDREEMQVLNSYIHNTLVKAMQKDAEDDNDENNSEESARESESEEGIDCEVDSSSSRKRSRRTASVEAQKATRLEVDAKNDSNDDDDDDDDEDDDYDFVAKSDDEESDEDDADDDANDDANDGGDDGESESEEEMKVESVSSSQKRPRRTASLEAQKATKLEMGSSARKSSANNAFTAEDSSNDDDDDGDYHFVDKGDEESEGDEGGIVSDATLSEEE